MLASTVYPKAIVDKTADGIRPVGRMVAVSSITHCYIETKTYPNLRLLALLPEIQKRFFL